MDISSLTALPTDSIYKFLAVAGLLIFLLAIVLPTYFRKNLNLQLIDLQKRSEVVVLSQKYLSKALDKTVNNVDRLREVANEYEQSDCEGQKRAELEKLSERTIQEMAKHEADTLEQGIQVIELKFDVEKLGFLAGEIKRLLFLQVFGLVLGVSMTVAGFSLWYIKVQVHIDRAYEAAQVSVE